MSDESEWSGFWEEVAFHEAGHVVVAHHFKMTVLWVRLCRDYKAKGEQPGQCRIAPSEISDGSICRWLAGPIAMARLRGKPLAAALKECSASDDVRWARQYAERLTAAHFCHEGKDPEDVFGECVEKTKELVAELWPAIWEIATALEKTDRLEQPAINALITSA